MKSLIHRLVAIPFIYNLVQFWAGAPYVNRRLATRLRSLGSPSLVIDFGGGTGINFEQFPSSTVYVCLDIDRRKIDGFRSVHSRGIAVLGDATQAPLRSASVSLILARFLAHHLPDRSLRRLFQEMARVLIPDGRLVFLEPVWKPGRWPSRLLWRYDQGGHPRSEKVLHSALDECYDVISSERFSVLHTFVLVVAKPKNSVGAQER